MVWAVDNSLCLLYKTIDIVITVCYTVCMVIAGAVTKNNYKDSEQ